MTRATIDVDVRVVISFATQRLEDGSLRQSSPAVLAQRLSVTLHRPSSLCWPATRAASRKRSIEADSPASPTAYDLSEGAADGGRARVAEAPGRPFSRSLAGLFWTIVRSAPLPDARRLPPTPALPMGTPHSLALRESRLNSTLPKAINTSSANSLISAMQRCDDAGCSGALRVHLLASRQTRGTHTASSHSHACRVMTVVPASQALWYQAAIISVIALSVSAIEEFNLGFYGASR